ncbi:unnamed protein product [Sphagnum balticum]
MRAPRVEDKIGSLIATDVPGYLTPESHSGLMNAASVGPPEEFLESWAGVDLNSQADWYQPLWTETYIPIVSNETRHLIWQRALPVVQNGRTALHMAASNGQAEIVSYICAVPGINVNVQDEFGFTPLHLVAHSPDHGRRGVRVIKELLNAKNIDPNSVMDGRYLPEADFRDLRITALHLAVRNKFEDAVDVLLAWRPNHGDETLKFKFNTWWDRVIKKPVMDTNLVKNALQCLNDRM